MPYAHLTTNLPLDAAKAEQIKAKLGSMISDIPGKSEVWLMVNITPSAMLWFKGTSDACAIVEVASFGGPNRAAYDKLTAHITTMLEDSLNVAPDRIYVRYHETQNWGWNGTNF